MADSGAGRGYARGRAGRTQPSQQPMAPTSRAVTRTPLPATAGVAPPGFQRQQQSHGGPHGQAARGKSLHRGAGGDASSLQSRFQTLSVQGDGGNTRTVGRGGVRGGRNIQQSEPFRTRPDSCDSKQGFSGNKIRLRANYFKILSKPDFSLYHYHVDFAPEEDRTVVRKALLRNHKDVIGPAYIFDGGELYTLRRLSPDPLDLFSKRENDSVNIKLTLKLAAEVQDGDPTYLQICNIVVRKCLSQLNLKLLNRNYFDPASRITIPEYKLELWPGYLTSMRQHDGGVLLCTEIIHKFLRKDTAFNVLQTVLQKEPRNYKQRFQAELIGQIVMTQYGCTETYRVDDIDFDSTPRSGFQRKGKQCSYVEYYFEKYGIKIQSLDQPLLISRPKMRARRAGQDENICLIPELCYMTGLTEEMRSNNNLMRSLADHTRMNAELRQSKLITFSERFHGVKQINEELTNWQLRLERKLIEFDARHLGAETIVQGNNKTYPAQNVDWTAQLRSNALLLSGVLDHWVVIVMKRFFADTSTFVEMVRKAGHGMNFKIGSPRIEEIYDDKAPTIVEALDKVLSRDKPKLVFCVVSNNRADRYSAIKKKTSVDRPVPSQVIVQKTMTRKGAMSIATKVAIQLSCKIGGAPWSVDMPLQGLMVIGYDVCHDSQTKVKSYGAMVASLNKPLSRYFSTVTAHTGGEELFNDLALNVGKAIQKYKAINNALPSRIAIYRDGVGEGQIPQVLNKEVEEVKRALEELYQGQPLKMTFIVVTKRINTRLFYGRDNPPPGTVVDDCITHPEKYDFFLVSQSVKQGSVSPTGYNVIYDTIGLDADKLQRLSYKLTHLYYNWSGTVRVPAPCQYAHKLAFLVGQNLHRTPNVELEELLYFL